VSSVLDPPRASLRTGWGWAVGIAALAFAVRLVSVLRGGGLFGRIGYDGSVYYASAAALTHGLLPYRDFLLLHPPGITLVLLPFAALGRVVGDAYAFALARCAWFGLGAVSTALVFTVLRSRGLWPAAAAAAFYALFVPAMTSEHTTSLEAVGSICLLGAVALLTLGRGGRTGSVAPLLVAGALLGVSTGTKIWGVALVLTVVAWSVNQVGLRRAALVLAGAAGGTVGVCLPFFLQAPGPMWRMVVADQLGRRRVLGSSAGRLVDITGLTELRGTLSTTVLAVLAAVLLSVVLALAVSDRLGRLAALLLVVTSAVLLAAPPWSVAYTGLAAPAIALLFGCATARLTARPGRLRLAAALTVVAGLVAYGAASLPGLTFGSHFPGHSLERVFARAPGCVTTDDPIALIETGSLRRNLDLRCPVVLDLSGYSYDLRPGSDLHLRRSKNIQWQRLAQDHLGSGRASVVVRFRTASGLSRRTKRTISSWPLLADVAGYQVHRPRPRNAAPTH
jgi:alpha-1,2-mannosyltransferase